MPPAGSAPFGLPQTGFPTAGQSDNPFTAPGSPLLNQPAAWLPPADAFAPQGSAKPANFGPPPVGPASFGSPPPSAGSTNNPFSDSASFTSSHTDLANPYASPSGQFGGAQVLTPDEVRGKLLGPAIGITLGGLASLGLVGLLTVLVLMDTNFHQEVQQDGQAEAIGAYVVFALFVGFASLTPIVSLVGAVAMFRGRGLVAAWAGAIASVLPCSPCFFVGAAFAIWGMVVLSDSRVSSAL
jgi:hypothetical protein